MSQHPSLPTRPAAPAAPKPSTWPTVIGIISIVFGLGGALMYGVVGIFAPMIMGMMAGSIEKAAEGNPAVAPTAAQFGAMHEYAGLTIVGNLLAGAIACVLLVAGIGILKRRSWSRGCSLLWATLRSVGLIPATFIGYTVQKAQFAAMKEAAAESGGAPGTMPAGFFDMMENMVVIGVAFGILWGLALPVFFFIWFMRPPIRAEMAGWSAPGDAGGAP